MKTIEIQIGNQLAQFTTKSVTFDGREFFYSKMSNVTHNADKNAYIFTYGNETKVLSYAAKDARVLNAIFSQVQKLPPAATSAAAGQAQTAQEAQVAQTAQPAQKGDRNNAGADNKPADGTAHAFNVREQMDAAESDRAMTAAAASGVNGEGGDASQAEGSEGAAVKDADAAATAAAEEAKSEAEEIESESAESPEGTQVAADDEAETEEAPAEPIVFTDKKAAKQAEKERKRAEKEKRKAEKAAAKANNETAVDNQNTAVDSTAPDSQKKAKTKKSLLIFLLIIVVMAILGTIYYCFIGSDKASSNISSPTESQQYDDIDDIIDDLQ